MRTKQFILLGIGLLLITACQQKTAKKTKNIAPETAFENPPAWAKKAIWYQIFVERFRNGDPTNDPTARDIIGSYPGFIPADWHLTKWTRDWYKLDDYALALKGKKDSNGFPITTFGQMAQLRRYGGDLQGVLNKIDYIDSLGVTAIYFNPLNDSPSLHKYDPRSWRHIDRNFGPNPQKDEQLIARENPTDPTTWTMTTADQLFVKVIAAFHKRGIKVILDYSWNHTGNQFWAWKDVVKKQQQSAYKDWYWVKQWDNPTTATNEFKYRGWMGASSLPEIKETVFIDHSKAVVPAEGNIYSEQVKQHIYAVSRRWLDPNGDGDVSDGVDGYRMDVAAELPFGFWRDYRKAIRSIHPDVLLIGELWWEEWPDKLLDPSPYLKGDMFDAPMNYRWYKATRHFFNESPHPISVSAYVEQLKQLQKGIRKANNYAMMNLGASHDAPRMLTSLFNKNKYKYNCTPQKGVHYKTYQPDAATYATLRLVLAQQFTYIGAPHIWAGDEMGMWGGDDPSCRKPLIWTDYNFDDEATHPFEKYQRRDKITFNVSLFRYYQQLISIRKAYPVLMEGAIDFIQVDDAHQVLAYSRYSDSDEVIALFNTSNIAQTIKLPTKTNDTYKDILNKLAVKQQGNRQMEIVVPARTAAILVRENEKSQ